MLSNIELPWQAADPLITAGVEVPFKDGQEAVAFGTSEDEPNIDVLSTIDVLSAIGVLSTIDELSGIDVLSTIDV